MFRVRFSALRARWPVICSPALAVALALFFFLWRLDFPKPTVDDLFHSAAGLNLAEGGDLSNPLLLRQQFHGKLYFLHPPLYSYALAGWLKAFGVHAASVTGFQMMVYLIAATAMIVILRRHGAPPWLEFLVPFGVSGAFLPAGLRSEPLSIAFTLAGLALFETGRRTGWPVFISFFLIFLGGSTAERMTMFSAGIACYAGYRLWREPTASGQRRWTLFVAPAAAVLAAFASLLIMIRFRAEEFWNTFKFHAATTVLGRSKTYLVSYFLTTYTGPTLWPCLILPLGFLGLLLLSRKPMGHPGQAAILVIACFPVLAGIGGLGLATIWYAMFATFLLVVPLTRNAPTWQRVLVQLALWCALLTANARTLFFLAGLASGNLSTDDGQRSEALRLRPTSTHPLLLDGAAARYVFDYQVPPGCLDIDYSAPFPAKFVAQAFRPGDIFVLGEKTIERLAAGSALDRRVERWAPFGSRHWSFPKYPRRISIILAEECKSFSPDPGIKP